MGFVTQRVTVNFEFNSDKGFFTEGEANLNMAFRPEKTEHNDVDQLCQWTFGNNGHRTYQLVKRFQ